jgi:hypothetical protein
MIRPFLICLQLWAGSVLLLFLAPAPALVAQAEPWAMLMGQGIVAVERVDPIPEGRTLTEARLVQPVAMLLAGALGGHLAFTGSLNFEGETIPDGELLPGGWGEGFDDRRHPHTYVHELMLSGNDLLAPLGGPIRLSVSAGKGFAPFGSDDPMSRPIFRYPVNHHLSQILERAVIQAGVRAGPVLFEGGLFNGDEPERPGQWPLMRRFSDSWSARLTLLPVAGIELSASRARVRSPEHRPGAGTDAWKWHVGGRLDRPVAGGRAYALAEWARTEEAQGFFVFTSLLFEGSLERGAHQPYYRFERSDRPEDIRTTDRFRSLRPHLENSIAGITRFTLHTLGYSYRVRAVSGRLAVRPFVEGTLGRMGAVGGGLFNPGAFYGKDHLSTLSIGVRVEWRMAGHRMGRYGELLGERPEGGAGVHHGM